MIVSAAPLARGLAVWTAATAAATGVVAAAAVAAPDRATAAASFPDLLALVAAAALAGCALWGWVAVTAVLAEALTGRTARGVPAALRRGVLLLCGLTALAALAAPASSADPRPDEGATIAGLPFPDRATGPAAAHRPPPLPEPADYTVRPGDSLWSIARAARPGASDTRIARDVDALVAANRAVLGDPDLIQPGQRLLLPYHARR